MTDYCPPNPLTILPIYNPENWIDTCSGTGGGGGGAGPQGPQGILGLSGVQGAQGAGGSAGGAGTQGTQGLVGPTGGAGGDSVLAGYMARLFSEGNTATYTAADTALGSGNRVYRTTVVGRTVGFAGTTGTLQVTYYANGVSPVAGLNIPVSFVGAGFVNYNWRLVVERYYLAAFPNRYIGSQIYTLQNIITQTGNSNGDFGIGAYTGPDYIDTTGSTNCEMRMAFTEVLQAP